MRPVTSSRPQLLFVVRATKDEDMADDRLEYVNIPGERAINNDVEKHCSLLCCRILFSFVAHSTSAELISTSLSIGAFLYGRYVRSKK